MTTENTPHTAGHIPDASAPPGTDDALAGIDPAALPYLSRAQIETAHEAVRPQSLDDLAADSAANTLALLRQLHQQQTSIARLDERITRLETARASTSGAGE